METNDPASPNAETPPRPVCTNCGKKMSRKGNFCPHCGQRRFDGRVRLRDLIGKFLHGITHLDNRLIRTGALLLAPGRVTQQYFQGRIKRFAHPVQFFFVVMFFFLLLFGKVFESDKMQVKNSSGATLNFRIDSVERRETVGEEGDSDLLESLRRRVVIEEFRRSVDSLPPALRTPAVRAAYDSSAAILDGDYRSRMQALNNLMDSTDFEGPNPLDSIKLGFFGRSYTLANTDLVRLSPEALAEAYHVDDWRDRILLEQGIKSVKAPRELLHAYLGSLTWSILALMAVMSGVLALLYARQRRYYVEHFIFLLHQHSAAFLLLTLGLLIEKFYPLGALWLLVLVWMGIALLLAMKRFYRQGWIITAFKWMVYSFLYLLLFIIFFIAGLLVVFIVF